MLVVLMVIVGMLMGCQDVAKTDKQKEMKWTEYKITSYEDGWVELHSKDDKKFMLTLDELNVDEWSESLIGKPVVIGQKDSWEEDEFEIKL